MPVPYDGEMRRVRPAVTALCFVALLAAGALLPRPDVSTTRADVRVSAVAMLPAAGDTRDGLPPGLLLPGEDPSVHEAIRFVADDIDDDGDLDVVANDGSLELSVWENDGAGHLTRKQPLHESGWQTDRPGPSWDATGSGTPLGVQAGYPSLGHDRTGHAALAVSTRRQDEPAAPLGRALADSGSPRAPPAAA